eukprot:4653307-Prorocentrum_lima.AAC.1
MSECRTGGAARTHSRGCKWRGSCWRPYKAAATPRRSGRPSCCKTSSCSAGHRCTPPAQRHSRSA